MHAAILIAILSFNHGKSELTYPMGISPWINTSTHVVAGQTILMFKDNVFNSPKCTWTSLDTDSKAVSSITYHSSKKVEVIVFEKKGKKNINKDLPFIFSCREKE